MTWSTAVLHTVETHHIDSVALGATRPFRGGLVQTLGRSGECVYTIVLKATFALQPGECSLVEHGDPVREDEVAWTTEASSSLRFPADLVPWKAKPEVLVVGDAYIEEGTDSTLVRVAVGCVDKALRATPFRRVRADGQVDVSSTKVVPLRYEYAAGGSDSDNPVGIDATQRDERGRIILPALLSPDVVAAPGVSLPPIGLGPLRRSWPTRQQWLRAADAHWVGDMFASPRPEGFDDRFFNAAPPDQWLDGPIRPDERIMLEGIDPDLPRLVTNLPGIAPTLVSHTPDVRAPALVADTLVIDGARRLVTLTYRARMVRPAESPVVELSVTSIADPVTDSVARPRSVRTLSMPASDLPPSVQNLAGLPFVSAANGMRAPSPPPPPPSSRPRPTIPPQSSPMTTPAPYAAVVESRGQAMPSYLQHAPADEPASPARIPSTEGSVPMRATAREASDAAAGRSEPSRRAALRDVNTPALVRRAVVDLLSVDPTLPPRLRREAPFAELLRAVSRTRRVLGAGETTAPSQAELDALDVTRVLSLAEPVDPSALRRGLDDAMGNLDRFGVPCFMVSGSLRPSFDEIETLKIVSSLAQPFASHDRRVATALGAAEQALALSIPPAGKTLAGLLTQLEQAVAGLSLPPKYLAETLELTLLERRAYRERLLFGAKRLRAELTVGTSTLPVYLPEEVAPRLPLLPAFPVVMVVEARPREDVVETHQEALLALAIGRVVRATG